MKHIALLVVALLGSIVMTSGQTTKVSKKSDWKVIQSVELPSDVTILSKTSAKGNLIYYIEVAGNHVTVSKSNYEKFIQNKVRLELVKSKNNKTGKLKYSTRQVKVTKPDVADVDLTTLFN